MMIKAAVLIISLAVNVRFGESAILEAMIQIDSDNFRMTSFLQRFKKFIAQSHSPSFLELDENILINKFIHYNDTLQANYDFSKNLLTMVSSYSLLLNGTETKISDVKITINFRLNQEINEKIILEDMYGENAIPKTENQNRLSQNILFEQLKSEVDDNTVFDRLFSPVVNIVESIIVAFIQIIVNGILGHVLTTAFDQLYNGRLITI